MTLTLMDEVVEELALSATIGLADGYDCIHTLVPITIREEASDEVRERIIRQAIEKIGVTVSKVEIEEWTEKI